MPRYLSMIRVSTRRSPATAQSRNPGAHGRTARRDHQSRASCWTRPGSPQPSEGTRVTFSGGKLSYTDGPFTESKEVVGGYAILQAKDKAEALEWTKRFLQVHDDYWTVTAEVREIAEG